MPDSTENSKNHSSNESPNFTDHAVSLSELTNAEFKKYNDFIEQAKSFLSKDNISPASVIVQAFSIKRFIDSYSKSNDFFANLFSLNEQQREIKNSLGKTFELVLQSYLERINSFNESPTNLLLYSLHFFLDKANTNYNHWLNLDQDFDLYCSASEASQIINSALADELKLNISKNSDLTLLRDSFNELQEKMLDELKNRLSQFKEQLLGKKLTTSNYLQSLASALAANSPLDDDLASFLTNQLLGIPENNSNFLQMESKFHGHFQASKISQILSLLSSAESKHKSICDIGSGDGQICFLAALLTPLRAVGVEIEAERVKRALQVTNNLNLSDKVNFIEGDIEKIELPNCDSYFTSNTVTGPALHILTNKILKLTPQPSSIYAFSLTGFQLDKIPGMKRITHAYKIGAIVEFEVL